MADTPAPDLQEVAEGVEHGRIVWQPMEQPRCERVERDKQKMNSSRERPAKIER
jgi:hypothetical protein